MTASQVGIPCPPANSSLIISHAIRAAFERDAAARKARAELDDILGRLATLTPREHEVFVPVVSGQLNKEIAGDLGTAEKTIKVHRARVMNKLQVQSVADLVRLAERAGIAAPPHKPKVP
jgi:FixJ family two-component response regulator